MNQFPIETQLKDAVAEMGRATAALSEKQLTWRAPQGHWSVAMAVEHLTLTALAMIKAIDEGCAQSKASGTMRDGDWKPTLMARWFLWILEPPYRMKVKTSAPFEPPPTKPAKEILAGFHSAHEELITRLPEYAKFDQNRTLVQSPFSASARYSLGTALAIIPAHMRRHLYQIGRIRNLPEFPKS